MSNVFKSALTVVAKGFDIPSLTNDIETEVMLDRMEVIGTLKLTAMQPARKECKGELVKIIEGQLLFSRRWRGCKQLVEEGDLAGEQVVGHGELFVGNSSAQKGGLNICRRRSLAAWVVGMNGSDE